LERALDRTLSPLSLLALSLVLGRRRTRRATALSRDP
jgi:hypothetical protein